MKQYQDVFRRYEKKYLLSRAQYEVLRKELDSYMKQDQYGQHTICNLYLDTKDYHLIRTSLEKPVFKEKIRIRSYGVPQAEDSVFLELKDKYRGVVYKRRISLPLGQVMNYLYNQEIPQLNSQILKEIQWFLKVYHPIPQVFIGYDRIALFGKEDPNLRITFDQNIRWRDTALDLSEGDWGTALLGSEQLLMEIKVPEAMPLWLCQMLTERKAYPVSFSKYGVCFTDHLNVDSQKKLGGIICA